jgi:hypothetical protein
MWMYLALIGKYNAIEYRIDLRLNNILIKDIMNYSMTENSEDDK